MLVCCACCFVANLGAAERQLPAFPGAEGFGAYTPGGRGGKVLFVTTLEDYDVAKGEAPIPGSFRAAVQTRVPRLVLFRVSGTIFLKSPLKIESPYLTIAGQSAPGDGICLARNEVVLNTHDVVLRHLRFRLGDETQSESGTFQLQDGRDVILDHCSFSWSMDENCTLSGPRARNVTLQWSLISESLNRSFHPKGEHGHGSLLRSIDGGFTIHHCVYAHNNARNPRPGGYDDQPGLLLDFRNNVVYDWGNTSGYSGLERTRLNYVGNYFKPGPSTSPAVREFGFSVRTPLTRLFLADNLFHGLPEKTATNWLLIRKWGNWKGEVKDTNLVPEPFPAPPLPTDPPEVAFMKVLTGAGATLPKRDVVDARVMQQIRDGTGRIIDSQKEVGGWPDLKSESPSADADDDGIPDDWEKRFGFDARSAVDGSQDADADGYTNVEEFLNGTDPKAANRNAVDVNFAAILAKLEALNARTRAEIADEIRQRPPATGTDGSAPPPIQSMAIRPAAMAPPPQTIHAILTPGQELQLQLIPAGTFMMGSPDSEPERKDDERRHRVTISKPFYLGATLVTAAEYLVVTGGLAAHGGEGDRPAEVTWPDAVRFCTALSKNTGRTFRLPTEAEWEYACRAGTTTPFNTGTQITTEQANFDGKFVYPGGKPGTYRQRPTPVRSFPPNGWGLYDMHGNAYQWCSDWYGPYPSGDVTDPQGPAHGGNRVIRGGRYGSGPRYIRSAARYSYTPNNSSVVFGFRVLMEVQNRNSP